MRFRPRFSLRTMLIAVCLVALLLGWLTSEWRLARARRDWFERLNAEADAGGGAFTREAVRFDPCMYPKPPEADWKPMPIPIWRRWLGDQSFALVKAPDTLSKSEALGLSAFFPESLVYWRGGYVSQPTTAAEH